MGGDVEGGRDLGPRDHAVDSVDGRDGGVDMDMGGADGQPDGDGGSDGVEAGPPLTEKQSFTVAATVTFRKRGPGTSQMMPLPAMMEMMLRLDPVDRQLVIGAQGVARVVRVRPATGGAFETTAPFMLPVRGTGACSATVNVDKLTIDATSTWLSAQGAGAANVIYGDVVVAYEANLSLAGPRDSTGPSLGENVDGVDPLGALGLSVSEPVASAAARLVLGNERVELAPSRADDLIVGFVKPMALALRYGSSYQVEADAWSDLAQNAGRPLPKLATRAPPELSPEDGFESAGATLGGAVVVKSPDYPVLAGNKSVLVTPRYFTGASSPRFTVRLARAANDVVVRVTLRPLGVYAATVGTYGVSLRIAVPGGNIVNATLPMNEDVPTTLPGVSRPALFIGAARTVEIALPAMTGPEIVFDLSSQTPEGCGLFPPTAGYLLDDLRID